MKQPRYEQGQFIGVDMNFVVKAMDILKVQDQERCLKSIIKLVEYTKEKYTQEARKKLSKK